MDTRSVKAFVMITPDNHPLVSSAKYQRRDVVAWANENTIKDGWSELRKRGYRIEKMLLVPLKAASDHG